MQEAWIDDSTSEDLVILVDHLRKAGALDVVSENVQMKKSRLGICLRALVRQESAMDVRMVWLSKGTCLGLREYSVSRWTLARRVGFCPTPWGKVKVKQARRPDGRITYKIENDDLLRISLETGENIENLRSKISQTFNQFVPSDEWAW